MADAADKGVIFAVQQIMEKEQLYRNALMWAFDRLTVDGGMSPREQRYTFEQIGKVLLGEPSPAAYYQPKEWAASNSITVNKPNQC